jgi:hypothetical protein
MQAVAFARQSLTDDWEGLADALRRHTAEHEVTLRMG